MTPPMGTEPSAPHRLLLTTDTVGGVWTYTMELATALGQEGVDVIVASLGDVPSGQQRDDAERRGLALHTRRCRLPWMADPWDDMAAAGRWLTSLADEVEPDVVHLSEPVLASLPWTVPTIAVGHSCVLSWWESVLGQPAPPAWERYRDAMRAGLAAADAVVAPSRAMLGNLKRYYGAPDGRAIPNGLDPTGFQAGIKHGFVLTAGRLWDRAKNAEALDRAAPGLAWPAFAAGPRESPGRSEAAAFDNLKLLGPLPPHELATWMARAAVFASPARYEPFGLSVLEAALAGCALVLGDIPSLREHWDGVAVFVPPDDVRMLNVALNSLIEDAQLRQTLSMRARRRALGFSARRMALAYLELYAALLGEREATACAS